MENNTSTAPFTLQKRQSAGSSVSWQFIALFAFILMEMSWAVPWMMITNASIAAVNQLQLLLVSSLILILTILIIRITSALALVQTLRRIIMALSLVLSLWLGIRFMQSEDLQTIGGISSTPLKTMGDFLEIIPAWLWVTSIVIILWWYGMRLSKAQIGPLFVFSHFRLGVVMFTIFALLGFIISMAKEIDPTQMLMIFLSSGLVGLVTSRVSILGKLRGGGKSPFDRRWLLAITVSALIFVIIAYGFSAVVSGQADIFFGLLAAFFVLIGAILATPLLLILYLLAPGVESLQEALPTPIATEGFTEPSGGDVVANGSGAGFLSWSQMITINPETRAMLILLGILAVIILLILSFRWITGNRVDDRDLENQTSIFSDKNMLELLKDYFMKEISDTAENIRSRRLTEVEKERAAERIRVIYAEMLESTTEAGYPRDPSITPLEYKSVLQQILPAVSDQLELITRTYLDIRYGEMPETQAEVDLVESAWIELQTEIRRLLKAQAS